MRIVQINMDFRNPILRDPSAHFWSCNGLHEVMGDLEPSGWFQIHRPEDLPKEKPEHLEWLAEEHKFPIYVNPRTVEKEARFKFNIPSALPLPMDALDSLWTWPFPVAYSCTFSYQIATAILMKYDVIDMADVSLSDHREKWLEAPNVLLWAGEAHKRGIKVKLSDHYTWEFKYGQEERLDNIPPWAPVEVVNDMFPGWSRETRAKFHTYRFARGDYLDRKQNPEAYSTSVSDPSLG